MLICADWLISALTCDPHLRASGTMPRPPGAPARAPSPAALIAEATVWAALWSMTRDGELPVARFLDAVATLSARIATVGVHAQVLAQAGGALDEVEIPRRTRAYLDAGPAASAAGVLNAAIISGEFHGRMPATTPSGSRLV